MNEISLYIHVPFCGGKCPYCDFYSKAPGGAEIKEYVRETISRVGEFAKKYPRPVSTVYFGGGTPSLIGGDCLVLILQEMMKCFQVGRNAEITAEANPDSVSPEFFRTLAAGGFNRVSMGLQSANGEELELLGRKHSAEQVRNAVRWANRAGITNVSLDLMMGLPGQDEKKLKRSMDFCASLGVSHISSYILKVEEGTPFGIKKLALPDDDRVSELYLYCVNYLKGLGYSQYEISNFAKPGYESRHNLGYWRCREYIGIGPSAHSFMEGERFYFGRSLNTFLRGGAPEPDGPGGDFEEFAMLALRLSEGLKRSEAVERFENGGALFDAAAEKALKLPGNLVNVTNGSVSLTAEGFLVSNAVILRLIG